MGKGTLCKMLSESHPRMFSTTISHTTRSARPGESEGVDYFYVSEDEFLSLIEERGFLEHAFFGGHHYGTSRQTIIDQASKGSIVIVEIEVEGVKQMKADNTIDARYVFIAPPSLEILGSRLRGRGTENEENIQARLAQSRQEIAYAETSDAYDKIIINDDLQQAYRELETFALSSLASGSAC